MPRTSVDKHISKSSVNLPRHRCANKIEYERCQVDRLSCWHAKMSDQLNPSETIRLLRSAAAGDEAPWHELQTQFKNRLHRMVSVRMDKRMSARVDASDIVQDAFIEAWQHLPDYVAQPQMPFYLWLRSITGHRLMSLHRHHLGAEMRNARREVHLFNGGVPETSHVGIAELLANDLTRASEAVMRDEVKIELESALTKLEPLDREILTLRHIEQLTNSEVATLLDINTSTASKRYIRALRKIKQFLVPPTDEVD